MASTHGRYSLLTLSIVALGLCYFVLDLLIPSSNEDDCAIYDDDDL